MTQDVIVFELQESFTWNCCYGPDVDSWEWCDRSIVYIRVSTEELNGLGQFLLARGIKEGGQETKEI